jgi:hypothetical protein
MARPTSRESLIDYSFRNLGHPVVEINVDYEQAEDRLDDALDYFVERHFDGVEKAYFKYEVTADDIANEFIDTDNLGAVNGFSGDGPTGQDIVTVTKIFQFGDFANINMFDVRYQMALMDYFGINRGLGGNSSMGLASYDSTKRYIGLLSDFFQPEKVIRFSKVTNKLHIDMNWGQELNAGENLIIDAYVTLDPDKFPEIWNDRHLKRYFTALLKKQWGQNLSKFQGVQLPGGVSFNADQLIAQGEEEILRIREEIKSEVELPVDFMTG